MAFHGVSQDLPSSSAATDKAASRSLRSLKVTVSRSLTE